MHLATYRGVALCRETQRKTDQTSALTEVDCAACQRRLATIANTENAAAWERRYVAQTEAAIEQVGMAHLSAAAADLEGPTGRLVRDLIGTLARAFAEMGVEVRQERAA